MNELQIFENEEFGKIRICNQELHTGFSVIHGYDNLYCVNPFGDVVSPSYVDKSGKLRNERILKPQIRGKGYLCVGLQKNGVQRHVAVHRLVADAFIPNPYHKPQINHIDGDKTNNHVSNLEWVTNQENIAHSYTKGLRKGTCHVGELNNNSKLTYEDVSFIRNSSKTAKKLADKFSVTTSAIYKIRKQTRWIHNCLPLIEREDYESN